MADRDELLAALRRIVGAGQVLDDPELTASYERDWTGRFGGPAAFVVRPGSTAEVAAVVRACAADGVKLVVQGGNTGLVGGGVPAGGEAILSLRRLATIEPVDVTASQVTCGAGVTLADVSRAAREHGLDFGVDFAARDSATVGGMVATNAGGERVLRYGMTRANVIGLEVVLADGTILRRLGGLPKDNVGYDVGSLIVGSEGTLAVVTAARLRLVPRLDHRTTALLGVDDIPAAQQVLAGVRAAVPSLECAELFFPEGVDLVIADGGRLPFAEHPGAYLLLEAADHADPTDQLLAALDRCAGIGASAIATSQLDRDALWHYREAHTEAINRAGVPVKLDVAVPVARLAQLVRESRRVLAEVAPSARGITFGHLAEGNLHVNVLGSDGRDQEITDAILGVVVGLGGSVSAEHGVGRAKAAWVSRSRSPEELATMRTIKHALDPTGLLNPGVVLPPPV